jgi:type II secretory pathway component PulJ
MRARSGAGPSAAGSRPAGERGITLIELLAALLITAFIVVMASRIFLSGNRQFLARSAQSQRLEDMFRLKAVLQGLLKRDVERCAAKKLSLREGETGKDAETLLKAHFPDLARAEFICLEPAPDNGSLVEWKEWFQPRLIEYKVILEKGGKSDTLAGSWIK